MDELEIKNIFNGIYDNKKVFITGHTGFKGSWLTYWLELLGAEITGYSLEAPTNPNHFENLNLKGKSYNKDIRNQQDLKDAINEAKPDIVFHLAAQPLVRLSYEEPFSTYETNIMGTLSLLEACKENNVKAIINITSDKCYENKEWVWGYRENDPMGGFDPYSSSKGCVELLTASYRNSFFNPDKYGYEHNTLLASVRAGNVVGGGDWANNRIIPDIMKSTAKNKPVFIRNPHAIRPWQHVLDPLSGYLILGQKLLEGNKEFAEAWNFGPSNQENISVIKLVKMIQKYWEKVDYSINNNKEESLHEAKYLKLDCSKAIEKLNWRPILNVEETIRFTTEWYKRFYNNQEINTKAQLLNYLSQAKDKNAVWLT